MVSVHVVLEHADRTKLIDLADLMMYAVQGV